MVSLKGVATNGETLKRAGQDTPLPEKEEMWLKRHSQLGKIRTKKRINETNDEKCHSLANKVIQIILLGCKLNGFDIGCTCTCGE